MLVAVRLQPVLVDRARRELAAAVGAPERHPRTWEDDVKRSRNKRRRSNEVGLLRARRFLVHNKNVRLVVVVVVVVAVVLAAAAVISAALVVATVVFLFAIVVVVIIIIVVVVVVVVAANLVVVVVEHRHENPEVIFGGTFFTRGAFRGEGELQRLFLL